MRFEQTVDEALKDFEGRVMEDRLVEKTETGGAAATREVRGRHGASRRAFLPESRRRATSKG